MYKPYYGDPVMTLRLPAWQRDALKRIAQEEGTTVSAMLREIISDIMDVHGYTGAASTPLPGQLNMDDMPA